MSLQIAGINIVDIVEVMVALFATYVAGRVVSKILEEIFKKTPFPEQVENGIVRVSKYVVFLIGFFVIIALLGIDITSIIVGLGAFSIAISFATSNIIQNLVSGILVIGDRAFTVGDEITIQSFSGKVVKIGIRTTVIERPDGDRIFIPNSIFITTPVTRKASRKDRPNHDLTEPTQSQKAA